MKLEELKDNLNTFWGNMADGWRHLWQSASGALTRFKPGENTNLPAAQEIDDASFLPTLGWSMLGGDVFEDERQLIVRLEIPGMEKDELTIDVLDDTLTIKGEKRFARETGEGRWRVLQCAYGAFQRRVPLPVPVQADAARATYRNGVLRIELPKAEPGKPRTVSIEIA